MMVEQTTKQKRRPWAKTNVVCDCGAEYNPKIQFCLAAHSVGTTGEWTFLSSIPQGTCPICRKKNI